MKAITLMLALWLGLISFTTMAEAGDNQECATADEDAQEAYDKTKDAFDSGNKDKANWQSKAFFEVYERNRNCPFIKVLADNLKKIGINKTSVASNQETINVSYIWSECQPQCKFEMTKGGGSTSTGMSARGE